MTSKQTDLVLGTAGHIDHGKSSLVFALTGTDPDRLSEEKERGITIELGFARLALPDGSSMGVVDVPGHERFVRQMIAGAAGIDIALLCIAADDGIMPQTKEHLAVLELLGIPTCVVALTKIDAVDNEWVAFMTGEIKARLATTPFADAPIVPVSSRTGQGLDALKEALVQAAHSTVRVKVECGFRLPVDRVFTIKGAGTVITGTLWSGVAALGDEVEVLPSGKRSRIRSIQIHGTSVDQAEAGHRVALNLNALSTDEVRPGDFLATPGLIVPTDRFDAWIAYLGTPDSEKPLESGMRVHVAHGTREVTGRVLLLGGQTNLARNQSALAQIRLDEPLPVMWKDRFVIRSYSPVHVIGGGSILRAHPKRTTTLNAHTSALLEALRLDDTAAIVRAAFALETFPASAEELERASGLAAPTIAKELNAMAQEGTVLRLDASDTTRFATAQMLQKHSAALENGLMKFHAEHANATGISKEALRKRALPKASTERFEALLTYAAQKGAVVVQAGEVSHPKAGAGARMMEERAAEQLKALLSAHSTEPPATADLIEQTGLDASVARKALAALEKQGEVVRINSELYFDATSFAHFENAVRTRLAKGPATAAELKDAMGVSRKYAIPLLECFDAKALTRREGDVRILNA